MTAHAYNSIGELVTTTDADGETKYQYNSKGQLSYVVNATGEVVRYTYDDYGRKTVLTYPDGRTVAYAYDEMDRLTGVKGLDGTKTTYAYNAAGQRTETKTGTLTTTYAYDSVGNLTKQETTGKTALTFDYLYDLNNRMTGETRTESGQTVKSTYVYDKLGQLAGFEKNDGYAEAYAYDAAGNMLQKTVNKQKLAMTYNAANELKTMTGSGGKIDYSYDANGNLTQKTMAAYTDTYAYNVKNQLTSYKGYDGYQQRYTYNAQGHMIKRESKGNASRQTLEAIALGNGEAATSEDGGSDDDPDPYASASSSDAWSTTTYVYDVTAPYYEALTETTDGVTTAYEYGVERISAYTKQTLSTQKTDYVYDGRGSVAQTLTYNSSWYTFGGALAQKTVESYSYTSFGEMLSGEGTGFRFNGEYYDSATGMMNLRARQYEPAVMRFVQRDLLKGDQSAPLSLNRYLYCENDSVNFVDPSGKSLTELWEKAKTAVSNGASAVKKVATAAYNAGKTLVSSAVQQVATVVKPVVNKVMNTVKEVATVAKTQGLAAVVKTLASNAASVPAYVNNVIKETVTERQAIQAKSAQQITSIAQDMGKDLTRIAKNTYGILSPRNQEIIVNAMQEVKALQAHGASWVEIARVITGACTDIKRNVEETVRSEVENELFKAARNDKHLDASVELVTSSEITDSLDILDKSIAKVQLEVAEGHNENRREYEKVDLNLAVTMSEQEGKVSFQIGQSASYKDVFVSGMLSFGGLSYEFGVGSNSVGIGISVEGDNIVLSVSHTEYTDNVYTRTTTNYSINRTVAGLAVAGIALGGEAVAIVSGGAVIIEKVFAH